MGLFGRKKSEDATEKAMQQAEDIAAGRGLTGKLMKGFMGADNAAQLGAAMDTARQAQATAAMQAQGLPTVEAVVVSLADTGQLINFDPVIDLTATLDGGEQVQLQTLVSKLQIPRPGDRVLLMKHPQLPGQYVYGGLAPQ
ncbi:hypothetical protein [Microbacterium sp.]|uniref:hypothetical protein n=1 Tax=Microbacterium sp. TaxID=51671 RepID=UPI00334002DA